MTAPNVFAGSSSPGGPREPVSIAQVVHLVLLGVVALGWATLDDQTVQIVGSAVAAVISAGVQWWARRKVTPVAAPRSPAGTPLQVPQPTPADRDLTHVAVPGQPDPTMPGAEYEPDADDEDHDMEEPELEVETAPERGDEPVDELEAEPLDVDEWQGDETAVIPPQEGMLDSEHYGRHVQE